MSTAMGPLSAIATAAFLLVFGGSEVGWWNTRPTVIGVVAIVALAVILIETFWAGAPLLPRRRREPPQ